MKTICEYLKEDREKWAEMPYISVKKNGGFVSRSFSEVTGDVDSLAVSMEEKGFSGGNIMLFSANSYEWMVISLCVMGYVGTLVPVDKEWTVFDLENAMSSIEIKAVFYDKARAGVIAELNKTQPNVVFLCIEDVFSEMLSVGKGISRLPQGINDPNSIAMILFTSGTTNRPKAIPLTQSNLFANLKTLLQRTPMTLQDRTYIFLPLNHVYAGVANFLYTIATGMQIFLCSDLSVMVEEMLEVRPTIVCTVPLILGRIRAVMNSEIMEMLRNIRFLYCGGSFTDLETKRYFIENGVTLLEAYGTTETSSVIALGLPFDEKLDSTGVVMENLNLRIINADENGIGEIIVKGGSVSAGYLSRNDTYSDFDSDGFYHTGDLGRLDETRHLYLTGRKKRVIITENGKNVYADELEALLNELSAVNGAAVFEEEHHIAARIYTKSSEQEIWAAVEEVNSRLPSFKRIRKIHLKNDEPEGRVK